ncbi:MAG: hypothetical protein ACYC69_09150 [Thermodesulfovibrionales bacterium]
MMDIKKIEYYYWLGFNFFVKRIMGVLWLIGGGYATFWSIRVLLTPEATINVQDMPSTDYGIKIIVFIMSLLIMIFGWLFIRLQKFFPQRIKQWMRETGKIQENA